MLVGKMGKKIIIVIIVLIVFLGLVYYFDQKSRLDWISFPMIVDVEPYVIESIEIKTDKDLIEKININGEIYDFSTQGCNIVPTCTGYKIELSLGDLNNTPAGSISKFEIDSREFETLVASDFQFNTFKINGRRGTGSYTMPVGFGEFKAGWRGLEITERDRLKDINGLFYIKVPEILEKFEFFENLNFQLPPQDIIFRCSGAIGNLRPLGC